MTKNRSQPVDLKRLIFTAFLMMATLFNPSQSIGAPIVVSKISDKPSKQYPQIKPFANALNLAVYGEVGESQNAVVTLTIDDAIAEMAAGRIDLVTTTIFEAAALIAAGVGEPLLVKWKDGEPSYASIILTRSNSQIENIHDLAGKTIAFEDEGSSTAYAIPALQIHAAGLELTDITIEPPQTDQVGYRFSGSENNSIALLYQNRADAIALSDSEWETGGMIPATIRDQFKVIWHSDAYPRSIEVIRADLDSELKSEVVRFMSTMHLDAEHLTTLNAYHQTTRFSELTQSDRHLVEQTAESLQQLRQ